MHMGTTTVSIIRGHVLELAGEYITHAECYCTHFTEVHTNMKWDAESSVHENSAFIPV